MNDIYVPMLIEEKAQLYLVETDFQTTDTVCFSICNRMKGQGNEGINTLIDKIGSYYKDYKRISLKLKEEKTSRLLKSDAITPNTQSIALGLLIAVIIQNENRKLCKDYEKIVITGNFYEDRLVAVDNIPEKYNAISKDNIEKVLFIYVSDKIENLDDIYNVDVRQFDTKNNNLYDVINFIFATFLFDIDYDPINKSYSLKKTELLDSLIYDQLENKKASLDRKSFQINILIDENIYPKNFDSRITEVYADIKQKARLLSTCFCILFSYQFKNTFHSFSCDYKVVIIKILDCILSNKSEIEYNPNHEFTAIDIIQNSKDAFHKDKKKYVSISPVIKKKDWITVFKKNLFFSGMDEETNLEIIKEAIVSKHKPLFPVFEIELILGKDWMSNCFFPELLQRIALLIEREVIREDELIFENLFDTNKWLVMGEH